LYGDLRRGSFELPEIFGRKFDGDGSHVFFQSMKLGGAGDRDDPGLLREQPCQRDLSGRRLFLLRELANHVNYGLVRLAVFRREARNDVAEVVLVELRVVVDLAGEESFPQWTEWNESDAKFLQRRDDFGFRF